MCSECRKCGMKVYGSTETLNLWKSGQECLQFQNWDVDPSATKKRVQNQCFQSFTQGTRETNNTDFEGRMLPLRLSVVMGCEWEKNGNCMRCTVYWWRHAQPDSGCYSPLYPFVNMAFCVAPKNTVQLDNHQRMTMAEPAQPPARHLEVLWPAQRWSSPRSLDALRWSSSTRSCPGQCDFRPVDLTQNTQIPVSSNMACWKMDHKSVMFPLRPPLIGDFPARHVWVPEGMSEMLSASREQVECSADSNQQLKCPGSLAIKRCLTRLTSAKGQLHREYGSGVQTHFGGQLDCISSKLSPHAIPEPLLWSSCSSPQHFRDKKISMEGNRFVPKWQISSFHLSSQVFMSSPFPSGIWLKSG